MFKPNSRADLFPLLQNQKGEVFQLAKLSHRHHAIMDYMLANPVARMPEIAEHFKVSPAWLSTVRNSDLFKARFAERRKLMDEDHSNRISQKMMDLAEKGIDKLTDIIEDDEQDGRLKLDASKMALESLGFLGKGAQAPAPTQPAVQVNIDSSSFAQAREKAIAGHKADPRVLENKE